MTCWRAVPFFVFHFSVKNLRNSTVFWKEKEFCAKKALKSAAILLFAKTASPHKSQEFQQVFFAARFLK